MNFVCISGRLTKPPEIRYTTGNDPLSVTTFTLAVDRPKKKDQKNAEADFIRVTVFGNQAKNCEKYLIKGQVATVVGKIQTGSYKNKNGDTVYTTNVVANTIEFGSKPGGSVKSGRPDDVPENAEWKESGYQGYEEINDDIPF